MQSSASSSSFGIDIYPPCKRRVWIYFSDSDDDSLPDLDKSPPPPKKKQKTKGGTNDVNKKKPATTPNGTPTAKKLSSVTAKKYHSSLATPFSEKSQRIFTKCRHLTINLSRAELQLLDRIFGKAATAAAASASPAAHAEVTASDLKIFKNPEFELILLHVANTDAEISTTPYFITAMSAFCGSVDMMHEHIAGDDDFARTALLVGINSGFFSKRNYGRMFSSYYLPTMKKDRALIEADREAIKRRWMKLDDILAHIKRAYGEDGGGGNETTAQAARHFRLIAMAVDRVKRCLEHRLVRNTSEYLYPSRHSTVPSTKLPKFDASFCINSLWDNNAVSRQLLTLVKNGDFEMFLPYSRPSANHYHHNNTWLSEQALSHVGRAISVVSPLGIRWSHGDRVFTYRNCTLKNIASELVRALSKAADAAADRRPHTEYELAREVMACMKEAHRSDPQCIDDVKSAIKFPLRIADKVAELCLGGDETLCVKELRKKTMEWVTDSVAVAATDEKEGIIEGGRSWLVHKFVINSTLSMVEINDEDFFKHLLKYCKADLTMDSIKELILSCIRGDAWAFVVEALIREFPDLANSWLDEQGNTLLGLCIMHRYANFPELLPNSRVKELIDFPSIDGLTPLMIAADHATDISQSMADMLIAHGADPLVVNCNTETVFHRAACSNNFELLRRLYYCYRDNYDFSRIVDLRRACDGATALQIALARGNREAATCLIKHFDSKTKTKFGKSKFLRTPEAMLLKNRQISLAVLKNFGITPNIRLILDSAVNHSLFEEESFVATTGLLNCGRICKTGQIYGAHKRQVITGAMDALRSDDYSWRLLTIQNSKTCPWVHPLMAQKYEEVERILDSNKQQYNAEDCPICLESFETTADTARGITDCGHVYHEPCWDSMLKLTNQEQQQQQQQQQHHHHHYHRPSLSGLYKCPVCRQCTNLTTLNSSVVHYDEEPAQEPRNQVPLDRLLSTSRRIGSSRNHLEFHIRVKPNYNCRRI